MVYWKKEIFIGRVEKGFLVKPVNPEEFEELLKRYPKLVVREVCPTHFAFGCRINLTRVRSELLAAWSQ